MLNRFPFGGPGSVGSLYLQYAAEVSALVGTSGLFHSRQTDCSSVSRERARDCTGLGAKIRARVAGNCGKENTGSDEWLGDHDNSHCWGLWKVFSTEIRHV